MPISTLTEQQKIDAIRDTYKSITGAEIPDEAIAPADQLESQLSSLLDPFYKNQGATPIDFVATSERERSNEEAFAARRTPFSDFQEQVKSGTIESMALFNAFMANNDLEFTADSEISPEELTLAQEFISDLDSGKSLDDVRSKFATAAEQKEAEKEAELARKAEAEATEAKRLADAEMSAFNERNEALSQEVALEVEGISHKFTIAAFATQQYDGSFELNEGAVSFENGNMNIETQEYLHGMLRQAEEAGLLDKFIGDGEGQFADKWELRDAMYSDATPYDYEKDVPNAQISERGIEILTELSEDMGLDVDAVRDRHIQSVVEQRLETQEIQIQEQIEEIDQEVESTIIATHSSPHSTGDFEGALETQARIRELNENGDFQSALELSTSFAEENMARISNEQVEFVQQNMDVFNDFPSLEGLDATVIVARFNDPDQRNALDLEIRQEGHMDSWSEAFTGKFKRLTNEHREFSTMGDKPSISAPRNEDGSIPDDVEHDGQGQEVLQAGMGRGLIDWAGQKLSEWFSDETQELPDAQELEAKREAVIDAPAP